MRADCAVCAAVTVHFKLAQVLESDARGVRRECAVAPVARAQLNALGGVHIQMAEVEQEDGSLIERTACSRPYLCSEADMLVSDGAVVDICCRRASAARRRGKLRRLCDRPRYRAATCR